MGLKYNYEVINAFLIGAKRYYTIKVNNNASVISEWDYKRLVYVVRFDE